MGKSIRDNPYLGYGNLSNRVDGKDMMLLDDGHLCKHKKQTEWHQTGLRLES